MPTAVSTNEICHADIKGGPFTFEDVKDTPGVYRYEAGENFSSSAALVITNGGRMYYVNLMAYGEFIPDRHLKPTTQFWLTEMDPPDEITQG